MQKLFFPLYYYYLYYYYCYCWERKKWLPSPSSLLPVRNSYSYGLMHWKPLSCKDIPSQARHYAYDVQWIQQDGPKFHYPHVINAAQWSSGGRLIVVAMEIMHCLSLMPTIEIVKIQLWGYSARVCFGVYVQTYIHSYLHLYIYIWTRKK